MVAIIRINIRIIDFIILCAIPIIDFIEHFINVIDCFKIVVYANSELIFSIIDNIIDFINNCIVNVLDFILILLFMIPDLIIAYAFIVLSFIFLSPLALRLLKYKNKFKKNIQ